MELMELHIEKEDLTCIMRKVMGGRSIRLERSLHSAGSRINLHYGGHLKLLLTKYREIHMKE